MTQSCRRVLRDAAQDWAARPLAPVPRLAHPYKMPASPPAPKVCATCGRAFAYRKRWQRCWDEVRHCSDACRSHKVPPAERALEALLLEMLIARAPATLCPSEVARRCVSAPAGGTGDDAWRPWMEPVRRAARRLVAEGRVEILQGGRVVDPSTCKGPIRIRLSPGGLGRR